MLLSLLFQNPLLFLLVVAALILSLSVHEFAHAYTADRLGDSTARYLGRLTLNPLAHLDPLGTLLLVVAGFGWGKPVPYNPANLRNPARDGALIAFAGPFSNFALALLATLFIKLLPMQSLFSAFFYLVVLYNLVLGFFNLIPVFPLDGYNIVSGILPWNLRAQWVQMASFGSIILLILVLTRTTSVILDPLINFSLRLLGLG